ncbi:MAG: PAS domain-containing sensor histidine kinase [Candidatus Pacebacteria bacterium]|jgi:PAS domain S-box-containing protein|nr:PAS domain-containing sensor histidine kinase [Candidatus Paceibacterota bacterium]
MQIQVGFRVWRAVRMFLIVVALTAVFGAIYFVTSLLFPAYLLPSLLVAFVALSTIGVVAVGSPDEAMASYHENQLLSSRELYSTLYTQSPVPYLTLDKAGRVTTCNQASARLLGRTLEELIGTTIADRFTHEDDVHLSVLLGKFSSGSPMLDTEIQLRTYNEEIRWVSLYFFVNQTFDQRLVSLIDITQHKIVDKAKSEFVALATHQLRTPVAAIRWNVELLERTMRGATTDKQATYLMKVARNVTRMLALINDFLSVSKLETGTFSTTPEPIELSTYLPTIVEEFEGQIKEKQIELTVNYNPTPFTYTADSRLFHIITSNLLSNAVKYVRPNDRIAFGYVVEGNEIVFTVADSGIGIPAEQLPRLFSKFFRASNAMQHRAEGTGLGLYIVKESVEQLGGTITVQSVENQGTTFVARLPLY